MIGRILSLPRTPSPPAPEGLRRSRRLRQARRESPESNRATLLRVVSERSSVDELRNPNEDFLIHVRSRARARGGENNTGAEEDITSLPLMPDSRNEITFDDQVSLLTEQDEFFRASTAIIIRNAVQDGMNVQEARRLMHEWHEWTVNLFDEEYAIDQQF